MADNKPAAILLMGPTASGKTTIREALTRVVCNGQYGPYHAFAKVIGCTTRPIREGEKNGVDYHFISHDDFAIGERNGDFIEVNEYDGHRYGIFTSAISGPIMNDRVPTVIITPDGLEKYQSFCDKFDLVLVRVFVTCDADELCNRLAARGNSPERQALARYEAGEWLKMAETQNWECIISGQDSTEDVVLELAPYILNEF